MTETILQQDQKEKSEHRESSIFIFHYLLFNYFERTHFQNNMLKNTRIDLVQNQPIEVIPNHHFIFSDTNLLADTYSPLSIIKTITSRSPGQKKSKPLQKDN